LFYIYLSKEGYKVDLDTYFLEWRNGWNTTTMEVVKYFESLYWDWVKHIFWSDVVPYMKDWVWNEKQYVEKKLQKIFISRGGYFFQNNEILNYEYIETPPLDISSTLVRGCIATKKKVNNLLMPEISEYIKNNNIYKK
jgi:nicotinic acid mononucleotide adenylyltransferase